MIEVIIPLRSYDEAIQVLGPYDRHAKALRQSLDLEIFSHAGNLRLRGMDGDVAEARRRIEHLLGKIRKGREVEPSEVEKILLGARGSDGKASSPAAPVKSSGPAPSHGATGAQTQEAPRRSSQSGGLRSRAIQPRSRNQRRYLEAMESESLVFGTGPAGTGKTFLAVAGAVRALRSGEVDRIVITRPVVEAGEHLGFLPGDLQAKLNPYLRPIYDSLLTLLPQEDVGRLEESGVIEVAPLAYMRGRTLSRAFVILDEAQNTTVSQMKMFLTRLGEHSRMVVTGDPSQSDLPGERRNGLLDALLRLEGREGIGIVTFASSDIVRHKLVEQILKAYEQPRPEERGPGRDDEGGESR